MLITNLYLSDFLSYKHLNIAFSEGLNVLCGKNTAGKTNLVDAAYLASVGRASRGFKDKELLRRGAESARVTLLVKKRYSTHAIDIHIDQQGKKRILIDKLPIIKMGELLGTLNVVYFSPLELAIINNPPEDRRRFLDISLSQQSKTYFYTLIRYNAILAQRNKLLKNYKNSKDAAAVVSIATAQLIETGAYIIRERSRFAANLVPLAATAHAGLTSGKEHLDISYESEVKSVDNAEKELAELYRTSLEKDFKLEYTTVGAHRDDLRITADGIDLRKFGSQGQKRTAVLSLKLAEAELFNAHTGEYPVMILDDVLSELDESRRAQLVAATSKMQTFITCTEFNVPNCTPNSVFSVTQTEENGSAVQLAMDS